MFILEMIQKPLPSFGRVYQSRVNNWFTFLCMIIVNFIVFLWYFMFISNCSSFNKNTSIQEISKIELKPNTTDDPSHCICNGENFCFKGLDEDGQIVYGRPFNCRLYDRLKGLNLLDSDADNAENDFDKLNSTWNPIILTVVSSNHFIEAKAMVESVFKHHPNATIIYYDSGLDPNQTEELKSWHNVEYRKFNFTNYPVHVYDMFTYAFKLAQLEVLQEHKTFYYFDASIHVKAPLEHLTGVKRRDLFPVTMPSQDMHSIYAALNLDMLEYLPMPNVLLRAQENAATFMFFSDSKLTRQVFKWWFLCGMTEDCIAPLGSKLSCGPVPNLKERYKVQLGCHRFDQAYFNIAILSYLFGPNQTAAVYEFVPPWTKYSDILIEEWNKEYRIRYNLYNDSIEYHCLKHKSKYYLNK